MDAETRAYWEEAFSRDRPLSQYEDVDWRAEIKNEHVQRQHIVMLGNSGGSQKEIRSAAQAWFERVTFMLRYCAYHSRTGKLSEAPPADMFEALARQTEFLARGQMPPPVDAVTKGKRGSPRLRPGEEVSIGWASAYINGCRIKRIDDKAYIKTICECYSIQEQTAYKWGRQRLPLALEGRMLEPELVTHHMKVEGGRYSLYGRSSKAINSRGPRK